MVRKVSTSLPFIHLSSVLPLLPRLNDCGTPPPKLCSRRFPRPNFALHDATLFNKALAAAGRFAVRNWVAVCHRGFVRTDDTASDPYAIIGPPPAGLRTLMRLLVVQSTNVCGLSRAAFDKILVPSGYSLLGPLGTGVYGLVTLLRGGKGELVAAKVATLS